MTGLGRAGGFGDKLNGRGTDDATIRIEKLRKEFGDLVAVAGLDLRVGKGVLYGMIGPNGSGKTTTIRMLVGLARPTGGKAWVLGEEVPMRRGVERIGYMPQEMAIYTDLTVHENLELFSQLYSMDDTAFREREKELLGMIDLGDRRDSLVSQLSGGMRHRVSLACALVHDPEVVFLDEPTVGVDPELRAGFWRGPVAELRRLKPPNPSQSNEVGPSVPSPCTVSCPVSRRIDPTPSCQGGDYAVGPSVGNVRSVARTTGPSRFPPLPLSTDALGMLLGRRECTGERAKGQVLHVVDETKYHDRLGTSDARQGGDFSSRGRAARSGQVPSRGLPPCCELCNKGGTADARDIEVLPVQARIQGLQGRAPLHVR
jgi:ABC-2 type transport system ATP-binding protein